VLLWVVYARALLAVEKSFIHVLVVEEVHLTELKILAQFLV